ncbi:hypothetical protein [Romboutsia sp.]
MNHLVLKGIHQVGIAMHSDFKETARGGISATETGKELSKIVHRR